MDDTEYGSISATDFISISKLTSIRNISTALAPGTIIGSIVAPQIAASPTTICAFLDLCPLEIRMQIYEHILIDRMLGSVAPFHESTQPEDTDESDESDFEDSPDDAEDDSNGHTSDSNNNLDNADNPDTAQENGDDAEEVNYTQDADNPKKADSPKDAQVNTRIEDTAAPVLKISPTILLTCRKIYEEASSILYDKNTFVLGISSDGRGQSPIMRHKDRKWRFPESYNVNTFPAFTRIKRWRVVIDPSLYTGRRPVTPFGLLNFCWALRSSEVQTVQICVVRQKVKLLEEVLHAQHAGIAKVLQPFDLLRCLPRIHMTEVNKKHSVLLDLPDLLHSYRPWPGNPFFTKRVSILGDQMCMELEGLTRGDSPIMYLFRPLKALVQYGIAFDSDERYKVQVFRQFQHFLVMPYEEACTWVAHLESIYRPTQAMDILLPSVYRASLVNDTQEFRDSRGDLVDSVEEQYRKMMRASQQIGWYSDLLRYLVWTGGPRNMYREGICHSAHRHIQVWTANFERDRVIPGGEDPLARELVLGRAPIASRRREKLINKLKLMSFDLRSVKRCKRFLRLVRKLATHLLHQFLEARRAREILYDGDRVRDPDARNFQLGNVDRLVDWVIKKPERAEYTQEVGFSEEDEALDEELDNLMIVLPFRPRHSTG